MQLSTTRASASPSTSRTMAPRGPRPTIKPEWRLLGPAIMASLALGAIIFEMRTSRHAALGDAGAAVAAAHKALAASEKALAASRKALAASGKPLDLPAVDFGCSPPREMRLSSGCWQPAAAGAFAGRRFRVRKRVLMEGGKSQAGEDLFLYENFFFGRKGGTFLEMGALDGVTYSNSYFFEKSMDWSGLMIEGSPTLYGKLVRNRPGVVALNAMVCDEARELHWIDQAITGEGSTAVGGAWELMPEAFRAKHHGKLSPAEVAKLPTVPCVSLADVLGRFGVRHVDLFSLDVEGAEASVLRTIDFDRFAASVIVLEMRGSDSEALTILKEKGYIDYGWVNPNRILLHPRFNATRAKGVAKATAV